MFIHDLDCGWMDHPFLRNQFAVNHVEIIQKLQQYGIREVYIDASRGLDVPDDLDIHDGREGVEVEPDGIGQEITVLKTATLQEEMARARTLQKEATQIVHNIFTDIRLSGQIKVELVEPLVEQMIDSIFRNQDALLPLCRLKDHDDYTFQHSVSTCALMIALARGLDMPRDTIREVATGALLHDVGKAVIPDEILKKPGQLTEDEVVCMQSHVEQGVTLLQKTPGIGNIALDIVSQHHERIDGSGYPNKLKGDEIQLHSQMGGIVDVYDAITSDRPYHKGMPPTRALGKMLEWSQHHFKPELVRTFIKAIGIYPSGTLVRLISDRLAIVTEQNEEKSLLPVVRVIYNCKWQHYLEPEEIDLAKSRCQDHIVGHESFEDWGIDPSRWCCG